MTGFLRPFCNVLSDRPAGAVAGAEHTGRNFLGDQSFCFSQLFSGRGQVSRSAFSGDAELSPHEAEWTKAGHSAPELPSSEAQFWRDHDTKKSRMSLCCVRSPYRS